MKDFVVALSAVTSGRSAWLILGVTGMAFAMGPSAVWAVVGYIVMEVFLFLFAAPRLRRFTGRMRDITLPDYFTSRFAAGNGLRALTVAVIVVFMIAYVSAQFAGGGKAFASTFGMEENAGIWLTALIVLLYTILGGYVAVTFNDVVQAFFMLFGLVVLPIVAIANVGWEPMLGMLQALDPELVDADGSTLTYRYEWATRTPQDTADALATQRAENALQQALLIANAALKPRLV